MIDEIWPKDVESAFDKDVWLGECDGDFFTDELCLGDVKSAFNEDMWRAECDDYFLIVDELTVCGWPWEWR